MVIDAATPKTGRSSFWASPWSKPKARASQVGQGDVQELVKVMNWQTQAEPARQAQSATQGKEASMENAETFVANTGDGEATGVAPPETASPPAELVISPPSDMVTTVRFIQGISQILGADILEFVGSWDLGILIRIQLRKSVPLEEALLQIPVVDGVEKERGSNGRLYTQFVSNPKVLPLGTEQATKRLRVMLRPEVTN